MVGGINLRDDAGQEHRREHSDSCPLNSRSHYFPFAGVDARRGMDQADASTSLVMPRLECVS